MNEQSQTPGVPPGDQEAALNERVLQTLQRHQTRSRILTGLALVLGLFSIAASVAIMAAYFFLYKPKETQVLHDYPMMVQQTATNSTSADQAKGGPLERRYDPALVHFKMTYVIAMGTAMVAFSVALLGIGTLITIILVMLNRRFALRQINESLAQISAEIKILSRATM